MSVDFCVVVAVAGGGSGDCGDGSGGGSLRQAEGVGMRWLTGGGGRMRRPVIYDGGGDDSMLCVLYLHPNLSRRSKRNL